MYGRFTDGTRFVTRVYSPCVSINSVEGGVPDHLTIYGTEIETKREDLQEVKEGSKDGVLRREVDENRLSVGK